MGMVQYILFRPRKLIQRTNSLKPVRLSTLYISLLNCKDKSEIDVMYTLYTVHISRSNFLVIRHKNENESKLHFRNTYIQIRRRTVQIPTKGARVEKTTRLILEAHVCRRKKSLALVDRPCEISRRRRKRGAEALRATLFFTRSRFK